MMYLICFIPGLLLGQVPPDPSTLAQQLWQAVTASNWRLVAALGIVILTWGVSKLLELKVPWFGTGAGKSLISLILSLMAGAATAFKTGKPSLEMILAALAMSWTASGGYAQMKEHWSDWIKPALDWLLSKFGGGSPPAPAPTIVPPPK